MVQKKKKISNKPIEKDKEVYRVNTDIVFREEGPEALLFNPTNGSIKILNHTGKIIWKYLNGKNSKDDIEKKMCTKFKDEKPKNIKNDLEEFLKELKGIGYIGKEI